MNDNDKHCPHCGHQLNSSGIKMGWCNNCQNTFSREEITGGVKVNINQTNANTMETGTNNIKEISLQDIAISDTNPRKYFNQDRLQELSESIEKHGVIQPITIRPVNGEPGLTPEKPYELVSGERRYRASNMAGNDSIPAYIKEMTDEEAFEVQIIENLQREDVHPMDEARGYQKMIQERGFSNPDIAERVDKSVSYVTKRLKMNELIEPLTEIFYENEDMKIGHAMELCRLPADAQEELLQLFNDPDDPSYMPPVHSLRDTISRKFLMQLDSAIFDPKDEELYPKAGPCETCPKRSSNNPTLFPDLEGADRCTDRSCFEMKEHLQMISLIEQYKDDPDYYFIRSSYNEPDDKIAQKLEDEDIEVLIKYDDFDTHGVDEEQAVKGIYVAGVHDKGKIVPIRLSKYDTDSHPDNMTKAERKENMPRDEYLEYEIERIRERKARKVELDREKVQKKVIDILPEQENFGEHCFLDNQTSYLAKCWVLYDGLGWGAQKEFKVKLGLIDTEENAYEVSSIDVINELATYGDMKLSVLSDHLLSKWLMSNCTSDSNLDPEKWPEAFLLREVAEDIAPHQVEVFDTNQAEKRKEREERYQERIDDMQEELEELRGGDSDEG